MGRYDSESVEILQGLSEGEEVVSSAQFLLDSESSKSSDFKRMNHDFFQDESTQKDKSNSNDNVSSATVNGTVVSAMVEHRMVTIDREAILKWGREADRVDFIVEENVDMALFSKDAYVMFTFEIRDSNFIIVSAMAMNMPKTEPAMKDAANDKGE